jgi:hypothetical protein
MMKEEFEKLAGIAVTYAEYKDIEAAYMADDSTVNKKIWVDRWLNNLGVKELAAARLVEFARVQNELEIAKAQELNWKVEYNKLVEKHEELFAYNEKLKSKHSNCLKQIHQVRSILFDIDE